MAVVSFGSILRLRNILTAWDAFDDDDPLSERELQDYERFADLAPSEAMQ